MNVLSIDTTADICSIALLNKGEVSIFHEKRPREHAKILLPEIERLLANASLKVVDLDLIVFGRGPGSFTGIRIATGIAQGLALSANCRVMAISSLRSLAWSAAKFSKKDCWVAIDARMSEVYLGLYKYNSDGIPMLSDIETVESPKKLVTTDLASLSFSGNGWLTDYGFDQIISGHIKNIDPILELPNALDSAYLALKLIEFNLQTPVKPEDAMPVYIRDNVTWDKKPKVGS